MNDEGRRLLPLVIGITGFGVLTFSLITPALPDLADALGVSRGLIGMVQGAVAVPGIFLAMAIGYLADRYGRRFVGIASLLVFGLAGMAGFFARSFWPLVAVRAVQGLGTSGILSLGIIVIGDTFPAGRERRRALGWNSAGLTITGMVSPILGGALAEVDPFLPFLVFAGALPMAVWARKLPGPTGHRPDPPIRHIRAMTGALRRNGKLVDFGGLLPFGTFALIVFAGLGFTTTPLFLESAFGVGAAMRGVIQSALSVGSTTGSLLAARAADRFGTGRVFSGGLTLIATGFGGLATSANTVFAALALAVIGLGLGLTFPLLQDFVTSSVSAEYRGVAVGSFVTFVRLGQAFGPIVGSSAAVSPGERPSFAIAAILTAAVLVTWSPARRWLRRAFSSR
ncbi:MAG: MFS transporter [Acidimicrobiia bacterium]|nr:MFS transporter [Acidimicrobiia bacterium]